MGRYSNALPPLCRTARIEGEKIVLYGEVQYSNVPPPLWQLSRIARSEGCLEWESTLTPCLLCVTYQVESPEVKVPPNGEVH